MLRTRALGAWHVRLSDAGIFPTQGSSRVQRRALRCLRCAVPKDMFAFLSQGKQRIQHLPTVRPTFLSMSSQPIFFKDYVTSCLRHQLVHMYHLPIYVSLANVSFCQIGFTTSPKQNLHHQPSSLHVVVLGCPLHHQPSSLYASVLGCLVISVYTAAQLFSNFPLDAPAQWTGTVRSDVRTVP